MTAPGLPAGKKRITPEGGTAVATGIVSSGSGPTVEGLRSVKMGEKREAL
jgi:hypothetical protein